jgi:4-amino-4-deoxy-L-arabinose transferase-like glycosyltransferase
MLERNDWIYQWWQDEAFRSKPVLTFWLMAASLALFGVAHDGGYSGEMVASDLPLLALRLPFALFAVLGVTSLWWMLARLVSRRVAWLSSLVVCTMPFFFLVARQAITDMPMVGCTMAAMSCLAMAVYRGEEPIRPLWRRTTGHHLFLALFGSFMAWQIGYLFYYFLRNPALAPGVRFPQPHLVLPAALLCGCILLCAHRGWLEELHALARDGRGWARVLARLLTPLRWQLPTSQSGQLYMYWFYLLTGIAGLGKGIIGVGLVGANCLAYIVMTGRWRLLRRLEIPRGILIVALITVPWHVAMALKDGRPFVNEYFSHHWFRRALDGVHGDRGTFDYYLSQLGIGTWPWAGLVPVALAVFALRRLDPQRPVDGVRMLVGSWATVAVATLCLVQTKFHHYILPAVPALAVIVGFWLDDLLRGRLRRPGLLLLTAAAVTALLAHDLIDEPKQFIELFIYRYDRPWPDSGPHAVDLDRPLAAFAAAAGLGFLLLGFAGRRLRPLAVACQGGIALAFAIWGMNGYMGAAAPHWGQGALHRTYYARRAIHGVEIKYFQLRHLADDWGNPGPDGSARLTMRSLLPERFAVGQPARVTLHVPAVGLPGDRVVLAGRITGASREERWLQIAVPGSELTRIADLVQRGRRMGPGGREPWRQIDADRLLAWQLNWRGENFWSSGEIWGETEDSRTVFMDTNNKAFLAHLAAPHRQGQKFFLITEAGRAAGLRHILPTERARQSLAIEDDSCNKFTLLSFTL